MREQQPNRVESLARTRRDKMMSFIVSGDAA